MLQVQLSSDDVDLPKHAHKGATQRRLSMGSAVLIEG